MLVVASVLAGALNPLVDWMDGHGVRRPLALGLILAALIGAVVALGALVIPAVLAQVASIAAGLPEIQARLAERVVLLPIVGEAAAAALAPAASPLPNPTSPETVK